MAVKLESTIRVTAVEFRHKADCYQIPDGELRCVSWVDRSHQEKTPYPFPNGSWLEFAISGRGQFEQLVLGGQTRHGNPVKRPACCENLSQSQKLEQKGPSPSKSAYRMYCRLIHRLIDWLIDPLIDCWNRFVNHNEHYICLPFVLSFQRILFCLGKRIHQDLLLRRATVCSPSNILSGADSCGWLDEFGEEFSARRHSRDQGTRESYRRNPRCLVEFRWNCHQLLGRFSQTTWEQNRTAILH